MAHAGLVERHDRPAVVIVPAFEHEHRAAHEFGEILRPIAERRQRGRGRQPDAHRGDAGEPLPLHDRVDEMRRPDHDAADRFARDVGVRRKLRQRSDDAGRDIRRRRRLDRVYNLSVRKQYRVGIGAADVDPDPPHFSRQSRASSAASFGAGPLSLSPGLTR